MSKEIRPNTYSQDLMEASSPYLFHNQIRVEPIPEIFFLLSIYKGSCKIFIVLLGIFLIYENYIGIFLNIIKNLLIKKRKLIYYNDYYIKIIKYDIYNY